MTRKLSVTEFRKLAQFLGTLSAQEIERGVREMSACGVAFVSFFMNKFRKLGFIHYNGGGLEVHSSLLNLVLHKEPQIKT